MLWLVVCLAVGITAGFVAGGWKAVCQARQGDMDKATWNLRLSSIIAALSTIAALFLILGWPWKSELVRETNFIPVTETQTDIVPTRRTFLGVPVWFWTDKEVETTKQGTKTVVTEHEQKRLSVLLLVLLPLFGVIAFCAELGLCALFYRWLPRQLAPR